MWRYLITNSLHPLLPRFCAFLVVLYIFFFYFYTCQVLVWGENKVKKDIPGCAFLHIRFFHTSFDLTWLWLSSLTTWLYRVTHLHLFYSGRKNKRWFILNQINQKRHFTVFSSDSDLFTCIWLLLLLYALNASIGKRFWMQSRRKIDWCS